MTLWAGCYMIVVLHLIMDRRDRDIKRAQQLLAGGKWECAYHSAAGLLPCNLHSPLLCDGSVLRASLSQLIFQLSCSCCHAVARPPSSYQGQDHAKAASTWHLPSTARLRA